MPDKSLESKVDNRDIRRVESLWSPLKFKQLTQMVEEVCLNEPLGPAEKVQLSSPDAMVVAKLGTRGIRAAMDFIYTRETRHDLSGIAINTDSPFRSPELFSDEMNPEVLNWAESFGEAYLSEAYKALGEDVDDKIADYADAKTADEQADIIEWLHERLSAMVPEPDEDLSVSEHSYHPIRLSLKAIGAYPNLNVIPSCLGVSAIAASFLRKAGADVLHARVAKTHFDLEAQGTAWVLGLVSDADDSLTDKEKYKIESTIAEVDERLSERSSYHTAVYTRLLNGLWCQVDPNYEASTILRNDDTHKKLDNLYDDLNELKDVVPGLEVGVELNTSAQAHVYLSAWDNAFRELGLPSDDSISALLSSATPNSMADDVRVLAVDPYFNCKDSRSGWAILDVLRHNANEDLYYTIYDRVFEGYVLDGMTPEDVLRRCKSDRAFMQRRIEDIRSLQSTMTVATAVDTVQFSDVRDHSQVEVGLPASSIGMAILNDFAVGGGSDLPPSFWLSHWSSLAAATEHTEGAAKSGHEYSIVANNLIWAGVKQFAYPKDDSIIESFISARKDDNHG